ncbi:hypothetical protein AB0M79_34580 [Polymorphospora sp. NPDC051019]|uniref:hypothetical protein n=1 Tax=Polymorphospora sp. NPDC051019 TaxID=3155725 RepID=UPI0034295D3D
MADAAPAPTTDSAPPLRASWTHAAAAQRDKAAQEPAPHHLADDDIRNTLRDADGKDKSNVYRELRLALTYTPGKTKSASRLRLTLISVG